MKKEIFSKNMPKNVINKGFADVFTNMCSCEVTTVTSTSIYIPEEKNMEVLHLKILQTREHAVTSVTFS